MSIALLSVGVHVFSIGPYGNHQAGGEKGGFQLQVVGATSLWGP